MDFAFSKTFGQMLCSPATWICRSSLLQFAKAGSFADSSDKIEESSSLATNL